MVPDAEWGEAFVALVPFNAFYGFICVPRAPVWMAINAIIVHRPGYQCHSEEVRSYAWSHSASSPTPTATPPVSPNMENPIRFHVSSPNPPIYLALPTILRPAAARPTAAYLRDSNGVHYLCLQAETGIHLSLRRFTFFSFLHPVCDYP